MNDDTIHRWSRAPENAQALADDAAAAPAALKKVGHSAIHGVSAYTGVPRAGIKAMLALRAAVEAAGFAVHATPLRDAPDHVTVELPAPVTEEVAERWNRIWRNAVD